MRHPFRATRRDDGLTLTPLVQIQPPPTPATTHRRVLIRIGTSALIVAVVVAFLAGVATNRLPPLGGGTTTATPKRGGSIVDGINFEPDTLLPQRSGNNWGWMVDQAIWAPLWYGDPQGAYHAGLAEVPTPTNGDISPDLTSWTIRLRSGLRWSDGTPLTAADCAFSFTLYADPAYTRPDGSPTGFPTTDPADPIGFESANAVDTTTVVIKLKHPYVAMPIQLADGIASCLPQELFAGMTVADVLQSPQNFWPTVTSGPFTVKERVGNDHLTVVRNSYYYQEPAKPYLDQLTFKLLGGADASQVALSAMQTHEIDTYWSLDPTKLASYRAIPGYTTYLDRNPVGYEVLIFNLSDPVMSDLAVRQAFTMGFDTNEVLAFNNGAAKLTCDDSAGTFAHEPSLIPCYHYDPTAAGRILDADGWVMGADGVRHKNGQALELTFARTGGNNFGPGVRPRTQALIQEELARIGMKIDLKTYFVPDYFGGGSTNVLVGGHFQIAEFGNSYSYDPDDRFFLASDQTPEQGGSNYMHYSNPEVDAEERIQQSTADINARKAAFHIIHQDVLKDLPVMYLYSAQNVACARSDLHNYNPSAFSVAETWNIWDWWLG